MITILLSEANIGVQVIRSCPSGNKTSEGRGILQAIGYCGGDFTNGAMWIPNVPACNFSDLTREICGLRNVCQIICQPPPQRATAPLDLDNSKRPPPPQRPVASRPAPPQRPTASRPPPSVPISQPPTKPPKPSPPVKSPPTAPLKPQTAPKPSKIQML